MTERDIQIRIRNALAGLAVIARVNVGTGWTGRTVVEPGRVTIHEPRPFSSGLPKGTSDLIGWVPVEITPAMVGTVVAVVVAIEVKAPGGRLRPEQGQFLAAVRRAGGRAGVARSEADAIAIVRGETTPAAQPRTIGDP